LKKLKQAQKTDKRRSQEPFTTLLPMTGRDMLDRSMLEAICDPPHIAKKMSMIDALAALLCHNETMERALRELSTKKFCLLQCNPAELCWAYTRLTDAESILDATGTQKTIFTYLSREFVEMQTEAALNEIEEKLKEYPRPTEQVAYGLRMNSQDRVLTRTAMGETRRYINKNIHQNDYNMVRAEYLTILQKYEEDNCFPPETKEMHDLEQQREELREKQKVITQTIDQVKKELAKWAYDSVQGNLSALPAEYRVARRQGKSVAEGIAAVEAEAARVAAAVKAEATRAALRVASIPENTENDRLEYKHIQAAAVRP
jgi:hypothetical protein